jgi:hypothetical protein
MSGPKKQNMTTTTYNYQTVSEAVNELIKRGFTFDFNLDENLAAFDNGTYNAADFEITDGRHRESTEG